MKKRSPLSKYLKAERGRLRDLALALKVTPAAINQWDKVPAERLGDVSRVTGIPMEELRPDIWKAARETAA